MVLQHIAFSKEEVLIDDLVEEEQDIPIFMYNIHPALRIDLDAIQRHKEIMSEEFQAHLESVEYPPDFMYYDGLPEECYRINSEETYTGEDNIMPDGTLVKDMEQNSNTLNIISNADINIDQSYRSNSQICQVPNINMDQMHTRHGQQTAMNDIMADGSSRAMNAYYANLSMMRYNKPFFFPPPDLGMVESMGSFENSSRFFRSVKSSNLNHSFNKNSSVIGVSIKPKNNEALESEVPLGQSVTQEMQTETIHDVNPEISLEHLEDQKNTESEDQPQEIDTEETKSEIEDEDEVNPNNLSVESYYFLEDLTKEGLQKYLKDSMEIFNEKYSVKDKIIEDDVEIVDPTFDLIYKYFRYVFINCKMEKEIPLLALVYMERLMMRTGILMNTTNWRRVSLVSLVIASKLWDDDSLENEHFPQVMKDVTRQEINTFERVFLDLVGYDLTVSGAEYAKYYLMLRSIADHNGIPHNEEIKNIVFTESVKDLNIDRCEFTFLNSDAKSASSTLANRRRSVEF